LGERDRFGSARGLGHVRRRIHQNPLHGTRKIGSVGVAAAGYEAEVVDLETGTRVMPTGERGEIRVRGPQFTSGYRNRPEENARQIRDGWLYTGDIGYYDDGYMFLVDRKKEMIIVGVRARSTSFCSSIRRSWKPPRSACPIPSAGKR
jgi:long-chain acyl-CoA synthetase